MKVSLFTVCHVFVEFVEGMESGIRNAEFATLFLLLFVENHFAFTIFFGISFLYLILFSLLSLFFLVFSFVSVIFGLSERRTILA